MARVDVSVSFGCATGDHLEARVRPAPRRASRSRASAASFIGKSSASTSRNRLSCKACARGGIRIAVAMTVTGKDSGSDFHLTADLKGGLLSGPIGGLVARVLRSDVRKSVNNLAALR